MYFIFGSTGSSWLCGLSLVAASGGFSSHCSARASHCGGFAGLHTGLECRSGSGTWALVVPQDVILPGRGSTPNPLHRQAKYKPLTIREFQRLLFSFVLKIKN